MCQVNLDVRLIPPKALQQLITVDVGGIKTEIAKEFSLDTGGGGGENSSSQSHTCDGNYYNPW